jgi:hypothetical protein
MSKDSNSRKDELLGMPHGTANGKLTKMILYDLADRLNLLNCYRCGKHIDSLKELSVEHKEAWMSALDPKASYFDLNNIAFSHLRCNIVASSSISKFGPDGPKKGRATQSAGGYQELKKGRESQRKSGFPNLRNGLVTQEKSDWANLRKAREISHEIHKASGFKNLVAARAARALSHL